MVLKIYVNDKLLSDWNKQIRFYLNFFSKVDVIYNLTHLKEKLLGLLLTFLFTMKWYGIYSNKKRDR